MMLELLAEHERSTRLQRGHAMAYACLNDNIWGQTWHVMTPATFNMHMVPPCKRNPQVGPTEPSRRSQSSKYDPSSASSLKCWSSMNVMMPASTSSGARGCRLMSLCHVALLPTTSVIPAKPSCRRMRFLPSSPFQLAMALTGSVHRMADFDLVACKLSLAIGNIWHPLLDAKLCSGFALSRCWHVMHANLWKMIIFRLV